MTCAARSAAPSGLRLGASLVGAFMRPGEDRGFRQGDVARAMAEIFARRRLDAIGAGAEIDAVQIEFENLVFRILMFEPERQDRLLDLAREGSFLGQEQVLGELLGQGRAALNRAAARQVCRTGAQNAERIDAEMRIEVAILDRDEGLWQVRRQVGDPHGGASRVAAIGKQGAGLRRESRCSAAVLARRAASIGGSFAA